MYVANIYVYVFVYDFCEVASFYFCEEMTHICWSTIFIQRASHSSQEGAGLRAHDTHTQTHEDECVRLYEDECVRLYEDECVRLYNDTCKHMCATL